MSATHLGFYNTSSSRTHVRFQFSTHASAGGNVAPNSAFEAADIRIYRANDSAAFSATQRSSSNGITMTSPFDSLTGFHDVDIDLTDDTDAGFYASGYYYSIVLAPDETVDGQTITAIVLGYFEINVPNVGVVVIGNDVITAASIAAGAIERATFAADTGLQSIRSNTAQAGAATTITLDASASAVNDFYNGTSILTTGGTGVGQFRIITDYVGATKVATVDSAWATNPSSDTTFAIFPAAETSTDIAAAVLAAAAADPIDANVEQINTVAITGDGSATPFDV
jgi:hypothetical protein